MISKDGWGYCRLLNPHRQNYPLLFVHDPHFAMLNLRSEAPLPLDYLLPVHVCIEQDPSHQMHLHPLHLGTIRGCIGTAKITQWVQDRCQEETNNDVRDLCHSFHCSFQRCSGAPLSSSMPLVPLLSCPFGSSSIRQRFQASLALDWNPVYVSVQVRQYIHV